MTSSLPQFNLKDNTLYYLNTQIYQNSFVSDRHPTYFKWVKDRPDLPTFYTYTECANIGDENDKHAVLLESTGIISAYNKHVYNNADKFNLVFTHSSAMLKSLKQSRWIPGGGIWIGTQWGGGEIAISPKNKLCSMVSSSKTMTNLHKERLVLAQLLYKHNKNIDVYGDMFGGFVKASTYLSDYMFSIIYENYVDELYFTEKILNCFAVGTVPIYVGAKNIGSVFNQKGVISCRNASEVLSIISNISHNMYSDMMPAIIDNHETCKQFICIEDYIWQQYLKEYYE